MCLCHSLNFGRCGYFLCVAADDVGNNNNKDDGKDIPNKDEHDKDNKNKDNHNKDNQIKYHQNNDH